MNQTPLTNMENRWVLATKEAFDALVEMGYCDCDVGYDDENYYNFLLIKNGRIDYCTADYQFISDLKQAYFYKDHFYDEPYEEFTITEEKVPFPELEDIEWVMVEAPEWFTGNRVYPLQKTGIYVNIEYNTKEGIDGFSYKAIQAIHENSKDFKVTWKLKEKIDRRLHKNRPLALAIGNALLLETIKPVPCQFDSIAAIGSHNGMIFYCGSDGERREVTIPDDYIIPDQVIEWMHESEK